MARRYPRLGALPERNGVRFSVWAPTVTRMEVVLERDGTAHPMTPSEDGTFEVFLPEATPGVLYRYRLDEGPVYPDPASRFQPQGVHGPSMVVDPWSYPWRDGNWQGLPLSAFVVYELHVGTYTPEGTFAAARERLPFLKDLGITAVELMPIADFPGRWNWGYDVAAPFAPSRAYGTPDDLRALVDEGHQLGLAIFLDVVYNHLGPDGAYLPAFAPNVFSSRHRTPWGQAINLDDDGAEEVREFLIENALHWVAEYHVDGLRLDATHAMVDESPRHFLQELAEAVRHLRGRRCYVIAEDHRNLNRIVLPIEDGGYGLDGVWSDDYHHQMRRILAGDRDGYFMDFTDFTSDLATIVRQGWLFAGQHARYFGDSRGTDPQGIPLPRFVHFLQNHDQVGNRPRGERLTGIISLPAYRAATALLLFAPEMPLLFMGQEWAARTPFCYFTDHVPALGRLVTEGRKREFAEVPDPQDPATFSRSRLDWREPEHEPHAGVLRLYRDLLALRRALEGTVVVESPVEGGLVLRRGRHVLLVALKAGLTLPLAAGARVIQHTEDDRYASDPAPPHVGGEAVFFPCAAAVLAELPEA